MRKELFRWTLEPGTGKAIELRAGQILRIEQVEGGQCVDFNAFNLHDYKEFMHCGRTRTVHGFNPTEGNFLWSQPPRERALLYILKDTVKRNDVQTLSARLFRDRRRAHFQEPQSGQLDAIRTRFRRRACG